MTKKISARTHLHSCYVQGNEYKKDAVVVSEIIEYEDGTTEPNLKIYASPKVRFWVTQPPYRTHQDKKEFESLKCLDEYQVSYKDKDKEIFKVFNGYYPNFLTHQMKRDLYKNPYLYGGNISIEALLAMRYKKDLLAAGKTPQTPRTGFFDIEKSLLKDSLGRLPLMVFTAENKVYLAMMKSFMVESREGQRVPVTLDDIKQTVKDYIDPMVENIFKEKGKDLEEYKSRLPFHYEFYIGDHEVDMIKWIFAKMHESKTSFIGVWNLNFDIPECIKILKENGIPLEDVFADPKIREAGYAYVNYREDKKDVAHFTQKWHWLTNTAHFQFIDSTSLYSYIRVVDGKEASYALDDILKKFGLGGKLKIDKTKELENLQTADWHREMLSKYFTYYAAYAMWDGMSLQLLEWLNNDLTAMMLLCDVTPPKFFVNQTIKVTNTLYEEWLEKGYVLGTGVNVEGIRDEDLETEGGAVLEPQNLIAQGMRLFPEWPSLATHCYAWQSDLDFSAQYPTNIAVLNISKQTKVATMLSIKGKHVQKYYNPTEAIEVLGTYLITPNANGVNLGVEFFGLPNYQEMRQLFEESLSS